jgi:hypothetical protein
MLTHPRTHRSLVAGALIAASTILAGFAPAPTLAPSSARPEDPAYQKVIDTVGPTVVTIKFVMKSPDDQGMGDSEQEASGVIIDPKGTVLCSYWGVGGAYAAMLGPGAPKPQDVRVLIGDDTEGKKARIVSHDSELDLAWIKLDEEPATPLTHIDLEKGAAPAVGQQVYLLSRLDKYFDRAFVVNEGRIRGVATKPRRLFVPGSTLISDRSDLGMPVCSSDAVPVGFIVVQSPDEEARAADQSLSPAPMIIPIDEVAKATKRAMEAAAATPAEPAADPTKPAEEPKKD